MEIGWLEFIGPRTKVYLLDEGYAWIPKTRDLYEDSRKEFGKSKFLGLGSVHMTSYSFFYSPRGRDSSYFWFIFCSKGRLVVLFFFPKGLFGWVFALRGCLAKILGCGNAALFWPYETSRFWD